MRILEDLLRKCREEAVLTASMLSWTLLLSIAPNHIIPSLFKKSAIALVLVCCGIAVTFFLWHCCHFFLSFL